MITTMRYLPLLLASTVTVSSMLFKILMTDFQLTHIFRDLAVFFILYYVVSRLTFYIERILKNYWKIL